MQELSRQLQKLTQEVSRLQERTNPPAVRPSDQRRQQKSNIGPCWSCGEHGHLKRNCPRKDQSRGTYRRRNPVTDAAAVSSALTVIGLVAGRRTNMLVDTGSGVTIVREDVWKESQQEECGLLSPPFCPVVAANGQELNLLGRCEMLVSVGGLSESHSILIAKGLTQECLLGADFLLKHGCVVDLKKQVLLAGGKSVGMCSQACGEQTASACHVTFRETIVVPAYCQMQLSATTPKGESAPGDVVLEPEIAFVEQYGLVVAHSLARNVEGKTLVQLLNPSPLPVTVQKSTKVGVLRPLAEVCVDVCAAKEAEAGVGLPPSKRRSTDEAIEQLLSDVQDLNHTNRGRLKSLLNEFKEMLSVDDDDLGQTKLVYHEINTGDALPVRQPARRLPFHQKAEVCQLLDNMLSRGIIEHSNGPWSSPIVLVTKKMAQPDSVLIFERSMMLPGRMHNHYLELMIPWTLWGMLATSPRWIWQVAIGRWRWTHVTEKKPHLPHHSDYTNSE